MEGLLSALMMALVVPLVVGVVIGWKLRQRSQPGGVKELTQEIVTLEREYFSLEDGVAHFKKMNLAFSKYYPAPHSEVVQRVESGE